MAVLTMFTPAVLLLIIKSTVCYGQSTTRHRSANDKREVSYQDIDIVDSKTEILNKRVQELSGLVSSLKQEIKELKQEQNNRLDQSPAIVAFTVCPSWSRSYERGDKVQFDKAITNYGGHYNISNSTFTCPWHGIYEFDQHILTEIGYGISTSVMKNFGPVTSGYTEAYARLKVHYNQGSNSVLLECQAGDIIWVIATHNENEKLFGEYNPPYWGKYRCDTSFSGKLVYLL